MPSGTRSFHPAGPVFVSIPVDILDDAGPVEVPEPSVVQHAAVPEGVGELAARLTDVSPERVVIVAGDGVATSVEPPS